MKEYTPHRSNNPYLLLAIAVLYRAYEDIYEYYKCGQPEGHDGAEALDWLLNGDEDDLTLYANAILLVTPGYGSNVYEVMDLMKGRAAHFKKLAETGDIKEAKKEFRFAWELINSTPSASPYPHIYQTL